MGSGRLTTPANFMFANDPIAARFMANLRQVAVNCGKLRQLAVFCGVWAPCVAGPGWRSYSAPMGLDRFFDPPIPGALPRAKVSPRRWRGARRWRRWRRLRPGRRSLGSVTPSLALGPGSRAITTRNKSNHPWSFRAPLEPLRAAPHNKCAGSCQARSSGRVGDGAG
jgi:hypothetical protein